MTDLLAVALAGFLASIVDGALGMGFGPTSATILLSSGVPAAATSTMVNLAKVVTGAAGGIAHWRLGNVDRRLVIRIAVPGVAGAVVGTVALTSLESDQLRPALAVLLAAVGVRILLRFSNPLPADSRVTDENLRSRATELVGAAGGVTNGLVGAWGPVVTPFLVHRGLAPRIAVGTVNTAEVAVAITAVGSLLARGVDGVEVAMVAAMLAGGVVAAPLAAYTVRLIPSRVLGLAVAALLLTTQARELMAADWVPIPPTAAYGAISAAVLVAGFRPRLNRARV